MRIVVEILNGSVDYISADEPCDVLVIVRDELAEQVLPDNTPGYASVWDAPGDPEGVAECFEFAGLAPSQKDRM